MTASQQHHPASRRRLRTLLIGGVLLVAVVVAGLSLWPRPNVVATTAGLPQDASVLLAQLSDGPRDAFVLDEQAPDFTVTYADGRQVRLSELRGVPVVLNFWATWCTPCRAEMPDLQAQYSAAAGSFELLAINMREAPTVAAAFGAELGLTFPLVIDLDGAISDSYRVTVLPTTYVIDAAGIVRAQHLGPLDQMQLRELLAAHS